MEEAASLGAAYVAAWVALMEEARLVRDDTVLVTGGSGAVGGAAVNLARWHGARVITTMRRPDQHQLVARNRPTAIIDLQNELLTAGVLRRTEGRGVDVVIDTVGGALFEPALESLSRQGRMVCLNAAAERRVAFDLHAFYRKELRLSGINTLLRDAIACTRILTPLIPHFAKGVLLPPPVVAYPLEQVALAYQRVQTRQHWQKVVLKMHH
jgi:NADPH:quinone reductase-like Zn-dependent oxidoreductase